MTYTITKTKATQPFQIVVASYNFKLWPHLIQITPFNNELVKLKIILMRKLMEKIFKMSSSSLTKLSSYIQERSGLKF